MIAIRNVHKSFSGQPVLRGIDLAVATGETLVIIGRSGCGKSVLLKHMIGILKPDQGDVTVDGQSITRLRGKKLTPLRMKFGMLFQGAALFDSLNVYENVGFALLQQGKLSAGEVRQRVSRALACDLGAIQAVWVGRGIDRPFYRCYPNG